VRVAIGEPEAARGLTGEIDADEDCRFVPDHPRVVARLHDERRRSGEVERAAVGVLALHPPAHEEAQVRVLAELGADGRLDVRRPAVGRRVDDALDPGSAGRHRVDLHAGELAVVGSLDRSEERIGLHAAGF
jgi:hypothetical protein